MRRRHSEAAAEGFRPTPWGMGIMGLMIWAVLTWVSWQVPPLQSPDELQHLGRAASLSAGHWKLESAPGEPSRTVLDAALQQLTKPYLAVVMDAQHRLSQPEREAMEALRWSDETVSVVLPGAGYYLPAVYAPSAFGLALGRSLGMGVLDSYRVAKAVSVGTMLALLAMAAWCWKPPLLAWVLLCLPMSVFQALAPVPDAVANALTLLVMCAFMRLWKTGRSLGAARMGQDTLNGSLGDGTHLMLAAVLAVGVVVLVGCRPHMAPLLLLPWWCWWASRGRPLGPQAPGGVRWTLFGWAAMATGLSVAWWAQALGSTIDPRVQRSASTGDIARWYAQEPGRLWDVAVRTFSDEPTVRFYRDSFVGILGWLDTTLPAWAYASLPVGLVVLLVLTMARWIQPRDVQFTGVSGLADLQRAALLSALAMVCLMLIFAATLLSWTPHPARVVEGVQGRYFLGPALVLAVAVAPCAPTRFRWWEGLSAVVAGAVALLAVVAFGLTLMARYH